MEKPDSYNLDTYNRVKVLQAPLFNRRIVIIALLLIAVAAVTCLLIIDPAWQQSLITAIITLAMLGAIYRYCRRRGQLCLHCGNSLSYIVRPLLLTPRYLSMQGHKQGDSFYSRCRWGKNPFQQRWAKITNRSLACHHCRLTEEKQTAHHEAVSPEELARLQQAG